MELPPAIQVAVDLYDKRRVLLPGWKENVWFLGERAHRQVMGSWVTPADPPRTVYRKRTYTEEEKQVACQGWPISRFLNYEMPYEQFLEDHLSVSFCLSLSLFSSSVFYSFVFSFANLSFVIIIFHFFLFAG